LNGTYELNYEDGKPDELVLNKKGIPDGELIEYHPMGN